jgi:CRP/FNR family transcriptional regulator
MNAMIDDAQPSRSDIPFERKISEVLQLFETTLPIQRRLVHTGETIYQAGQPFKSLYILNTGLVKMVNLSSDGREQVVALHFRGDWLGLDGIASGRYGCDAIAMDTGELWSINYQTLLQEAVRAPALLVAMHEAMSRELARDHESLQSLCALPADARVAGFLRYWVDALAKRGLRTDQISLRMTRAEIGNHLGMTLESVSRAMSRLARGDVIRFAEKGRRDIQIPNADALSKFIDGKSARAPLAAAC